MDQEDSPASRLPTLTMVQAKANRLIAEALALRDGERAPCTHPVKQRPNMRKPAGPDNEYFLNEDGSFQTKPCKNRPILCGNVCHNHGGNAPQVRAKANRRLLAMVEPSIIRLAALVDQGEHLPTALGAIRTVLERAGSKTPIGPQAKEAGDQSSRPQIIIGIKVGGIAQPVVSVEMQQLPESIEDGELVGDDPLDANGANDEDGDDN
jgi:hypothetical protein